MKIYQQIVQNEREEFSEKGKIRECAFILFVFMFCKFFPFLYFSSLKESLTWLDDCRPCHICCVFEICRQTKKTVYKNMLSTTRIKWYQISIILHNSSLRWIIHERYTLIQRWWFAQRCFHFFSLPINYGRVSLKNHIFFIAIK